MRKTVRPAAPFYPDLAGLDAALSASGLARSPRAAAAAELRRTSAAPRVAANGVHWLPVPGWNLPWLWAGFSTRKGGLSRAFCAEDAEGELNLGLTAGDERQAVLANRSLLAEAVTGSAETPIATVKQFHSNLLLRASAADAGQQRPRKAGVPSDRSSSLGCKAGVPSDRSSSLGCKADGLMTGEAGVLLAVLVADCIPVLVADRKRRVVAAFHAGWRGTVKRIVETGIGRMRLEFSSRPADLIAAIGPGIGPCCYAVGEEVISEFESQFSYAGELFRQVYDADPVQQKYPMLFLTQRAPGHSLIGPQIHLDLVEANRRQLLAAGVKARAIQLVGGCTSCQPELFFSHRGSRGHAGRMMAVIGIRDG